MYVDCKGLGVYLYLVYYDTIFVTVVQPLTNVGTPEPVIRRSMDDNSFPTALILGSETKKYTARHWNDPHIAGPTSLKSPCYPASRTTISGLFGTTLSTKAAMEQSESEEPY